MAKLSSIAKNKKRIKQSQSARKKRLQLREIIKTGMPEDRETAILKLQKARRNDSMIRVRNRCYICGRARGTYRKVHLCRIHFREAAMRGDIPGLKKSSW